MQMAGFPRLSIDPAICGGRPVVAGTRMRVTDILGMLADGAGASEIERDFPYVSAEDVRDCLRFAARSVHGGITNLRSQAWQADSGNRLGAGERFIEVR